MDSYKKGCIGSVLTLKCLSERNVIKPNNERKVEGKKESINLPIKCSGVCKFIVWRHATTSFGVRQKSNAAEKIAEGSGKAGKIFLR